MLLLPTYAPELNPMDNVWDYLSANKLSSCVQNNYNATVKACVNA
jgi:hypothetical protein